MFMLVFRFRRIRVLAVLIFENRKARHYQGKIIIMHEKKALKVTKATEFLAF